MGALAALPIPPDLNVLVFAAILVILRLSLMVFMLPAFGESSMNTRVRITVVLAISLALFPIILPDQMEAVRSHDIVMLAAFEALIGFALGFGFRVLIFALMIAGTIMAQAMSLSQLLGSGMASDPNPSVAMLLMALGATLFVTLDFHTQSLGLFYDSYQLFPLGEVPRLDMLGEWAMARCAGAFALGVSLSLPFVLINFVYNVILGLINQAMPQMMVTFVGVPANVLAGLILLTLAVTTLAVVWLKQFDAAFQGFW